MTPLDYAKALAANGGDYNAPGLNVDLVTVFVPARDAYDRTDPALPDGERWRLAAEAHAASG